MGRLSDDEIKSMVDEAAANEDSDKIKLQIIENRNKLDTMVYNIRKMLNEQGDKLGEETTANLTTNLEAAEAAMDSDDVETLSTALKNLEQALHAAGAEMYAQAEAQQTTEDEVMNEDVNVQTENLGDDDVIDAEYQDVG